jgi:MGT family glycosyltransferase
VVTRFLFVVPPLTGHINPTVSVGRELGRRGHQVAWVGHASKVRPLLPSSATLIPLDDRVPRRLFAKTWQRSASARGAAALKLLWEDFLIPLCRAMRPGIEVAVDEFRPDVLVVDQQAIAGALVARRRQLPWATLATTSASVVNPLHGLPKVEGWLDDHLARLQREADLPAVAGGERSPALVVVFSTRELVGDYPVPASHRFVGPAIHDRPEDTPFPWQALADRPRVLVTLGTVNADTESGARFYREAAAAFADGACQAILAAPPARVSPASRSILVRAYVPQLALLAKVDAVVCHAGHNTVVEALAHGLPLVVAPIKDDQPIVAQQVVDAGAGLRVKFGRVRAAALRDAVDRILGEPNFRQAAATLRASFAHAGGAPRAADYLEALA